MPVQSDLPLKVDRKLAHLVKKMMNPNDSSPPNTDYVMTILRMQHREYQNKDFGEFRKDVEGCIALLMKEKIWKDKTNKETSNDKSFKLPTTITTTTTTNLTSSRKRRVPERDDDDTPRLISKEDAHRHVKNNASTEPLPSSLNAALRNRYKQQQQQQQKQRQNQHKPKTDLTTEIPTFTNDSEPLPTNIAVPDASENNPLDSSIGVPPSSLAEATGQHQHLYNLDDSFIPPPQQQQQTTDKSTSHSGGSPNKRKKNKLSRLMAASSAGPSSSFIMASSRPTERFSDLGGLGDIIQQLRELVEYPLLRPELYRHLGIDPPRGVLLRGPPGTGKTHLANAVAGELNVNYYRVSAPELVSGMSGESEGRIRDLFQMASDTAPSIIFLDEIDAIAPKRFEGGGGSGGARGMEKRMVAQLLTCMDAIAPRQNRDNNAVIVLAATNQPDSLDSALRRAGRFDREILLGVPDEEVREKILRAMTAGMRLAGDLDFKLLARKTPGFVGADVRSLTREAAVLAIHRIYPNVLDDVVVVPNIANAGCSTPTEATGGENWEAGDFPKKVIPLTPEQMEPLFITMEDFLGALPSVQPSSQREGFATVPDVSWENIGALQSIREELTMSVLEPIRNPEKFKALGLTLPMGVLLYGPPGCGKTLLAKAIANESGANFISIKGPELLDKYVGESERAVRLVFERARASSPCVVFFDELDSLVPKRGSDSSSGGGSGVSERVVNQLLTEMDGLDSRRSVFVIAATNRPELIDPAMMRPGRLDKLLYVPLPTAQDRVSILKALSTNVKLGNDVDLEVIGSSHRATGYSGADCAALLREAGLAVIKEDAVALIKGTGKVPFEDLRILRRHFDLAFKAVLPSVSKKDQKRYDHIRARMASARSHANVADDDVEPGTGVTEEETNVPETRAAVEEVDDLEYPKESTPAQHFSNDAEGELNERGVDESDDAIVATPAETAELDIPGRCSEDQPKLEVEISGEMDCETEDLNIPMPAGDNAVIEMEIESSEAEKEHTMVDDSKAVGGQLGDEDDDLKKAGILVEGSEEMPISVNEESIVQDLEPAVLDDTAEPDKEQVPKPENPETRTNDESGDLSNDGKILDPRTNSSSSADDLEAKLASTNDDNNQKEMSLEGGELSPATDIVVDSSTTMADKSSKTAEIDMEKLPKEGVEDETNNREPIGEEEKEKLMDSAAETT